jgi:hypothetical protein
MDRRVKTAKRDRGGNIVALCNVGQSWSPRRTQDVVRDIKSGKKSYYVQAGGRRRYVRTVSGVLQTTLDAEDETNLARLPTA